MNLPILEFKISGYVFPVDGEGHQETADRLTTALGFGSTNTHPVKVEFKPCEIVSTGGQNTPSEVM